MGLARRSQITVLATIVFLVLFFMIYLSLPTILKNFKKPLKSNKNNKYRIYNKLDLTGHISNFEWSHAELCPSSGADLRLVILVMSEPRNIIARHAIRKTWGHFAFRSDVALAFFISTPPDKIVIDKIEEEDMVYGDIIIGRFKDSKFNLKLKTLLMLEWVDINCNRVPLLLKTDDDMFINVPRLIQFTKETSQRNATKTIWGPMMKAYHPVRKTQSKSEIFPYPEIARYQEIIRYPEILRYPEKYLNNTSGNTYLLTTDVIKDILSEALNEPYLGNGDIFITRILASKLGIERKEEPLFNIKRFSARPHPCIVQRMISFPGVLSEIFIFWQLMFNDTVDCDTFRIIWVPELVNLDEEKLI